MSTVLFFLVPIGMLAVVWSLCFVGACFPTGGLPGPPYSNIILAEPSLVAYWPAERFPEFAAAGGGTSAAAAPPGQHRRWRRPRSFRKKSQRQLHKSAEVYIRDDISNNDGQSTG